MHSRRRPTVEIATSKLLIPKDVRLNDTLVQLYSKLNRGDINKPGVAATAGALSAIGIPFSLKDSSEGSRNLLLTINI